MTEEHDTVEGVNRDADEEDDGIEVAEEAVVYGDESLIADDVVRVVPRNKAVTMVFAATVVNLNHPNCRHCVRSLVIISPPPIFCFTLLPESAVSEQSSFQ